MAYSDRTELLMQVHFPEPATVSRVLSGDPLGSSSARRALAGFFVSGVLLSFLGAILFSWQHHLTSQYGIVGLYYAWAHCGFGWICLAFAGSAAPQRPRLDAGAGVRARWRGIPLSGVCFAAVLAVVASRRDGDRGIRRGPAAHGDLSRDLADVPARSRGDHESRGDLVRARMFAPSRC